MTEQNDGGLPPTESNEFQTVIDEAQRDIWPIRTINWMVDQASQSLGHKIFIGSTVLVSLVLLIGLIAELWFWPLLFIIMAIFGVIGSFKLFPNGKVWRRVLLVVLCLPLLTPGFMYYTSALDKDWKRALDPPTIHVVWNCSTKDYLESQQPLLDRWNPLGASDLFGDGNTSEQMILMYARKHGISADKLKSYNPKDFDEDSTMTVVIFQCVSDKAPPPVRVVDAGAEAGTEENSEESIEENSAEALAQRAKLVIYFGANIQFKTISDSEDDEDLKRDSAFIAVHVSEDLLVRPEYFDSGFLRATSNLSLKTNEFELTPTKEPAPVQDGVPSKTPAKADGGTSL